MNRDINPLREIITFNGAQEGIVSIFAACCDPGDEVIVVEPYFDAYLQAATLFQLKTHGIPLELPPLVREEYQSKENSVRSFSAGELVLDMERLEEMITPKTKLLVLNTPHNPTGKVFTMSELEDIATIVRRHPQLTVLSDEVYEFMSFAPSVHTRIASLPDMFDRVISLYSAGKTFSCTGWRVGFAIAPANLAGPILQVHNAIPFCGATPFEVAISTAFKKGTENGYFTELPNMLEKKRDILVAALTSANLNPVIPQGGYFVTCDASRLPFSSSVLQRKTSSSSSLSPDVQMALHLVEHCGLAVIPTSPFYTKQHQHLAGSTIRLAYCKDDVTLQKAVAAIQALV